MVWEVAFQRGAQVVECAVTFMGVDYGSLAVISCKHGKEGMKSGAYLFRLDNTIVHYTTYALHEIVRVKRYLERDVPM